MTIAPSSCGCLVRAQLHAAAAVSATNACSSATATYRPRAFGTSGQCDSSHFKFRECRSSCARCRAISGGSVTSSIVIFGVALACTIFQWPHCWRWLLNYNIHALMDTPLVLKETGRPFFLPSPRRGRGAGGEGARAHRPSTFSPHSRSRPLSLSPSFVGSRTICKQREIPSQASRSIA